jgi:hypothetical protein
MSNDERDHDSNDGDQGRGDDRDDALKIRARGSTVISVREWYGGRWKREDIDRNERHVLRDGLLVHNRGGRVRYYADDNNDGIWTRTNLGRGQNTLRRAESLDPVISGGRLSSSNDKTWGHDSGSSNEAYRFDLVNGQVTNLQEFDDGAWRMERIEANETWTFDGTNLIQTEREHDGREISTFTDPNGDGLFTKVREVFTASF